MSDRINNLTVVLESDIRTDDADELIGAIRLLQGVVAVGGNVADPQDYVVKERIKREISLKLWEVLHENDPPSP